MTDGEEMEKERVDQADILAAARERHGLKSLGEIRYAVVEKDGHISIVPREQPRGA
jgi:uncharacterized membrane protein YcaP (DUF421 family)